jgi:hypothetical protein
MQWKTTHCASNRNESKSQSLELHDAKNASPNNFAIKRGSISQVKNKTRAAIG